MEFKLSVLQGLDQSFNDGKALGGLPLVSSPNLEVPVRLKFLRSFAECLAQALSKLEFGFASGGVAVRKAVLTEVMDGRQQFLKLINAEREFLKKVGLRSRALLFSCTCSWHSREKSLTEGSKPSKETTGLRL